MNIIAKFDKRSVERLRRILGWVAFAKRPLRRREFQSALAFGEGNPQVDEPIPPYIFEMGAPLIEQLRDSTFSFIHVSVKEYGFSILFTQRCHHSVLIILSSQLP